MIFSRRKPTDEQLNPDRSPVYLTAEGARKLEERLKRLKGSLDRLIEETRRAAAYGDRSENAEYTAAKGALRRANFEIARLEDEFRRVEIITPGKGTSGFAQVGSTVVLEGKEGERKMFQIVGSDESDPAKGRISHKSPFGAALLNKLKGQTAEIKTPAGTKIYKILEIK